MPIRVDSIRLRLTLWYAGILALALAAMATATYAVLDQLATRRALWSMMETGGTVLAAAGRDPDALEAAVARFRAPDRRVLLLDEEGRVLAASEAARFGPPVAPEVFAALPAAEHLRPAPGRGPVARVVRIRPDDRPVRIGVRRLRRRQGLTLAVVASTRPEQTVRDQAVLALMLAAGLTLVLAVVPGSILVRRSLAPVGDMTRKAARIGAERLDERLPVGNPRDELGALAGVLNELLDRLEEAFARQRRFMAEAAHELRTPAAVIRAETELALSGERRAEEYREALRVVSGEAERLARTVDDLLTLSRAQAGEYPMRRDYTDLAEVAADVVRAHRALAGAREIVLELDADEELPLRADADLLTRMLRNLVDNAVKHGRPGDRVRVEARRTDGGYRVRVSDTGPGIPPDAATRIWEPFYRGSEARTAGPEGGAGLGLPIARWIAAAHGGRLDLAGSGPAGSVFEVTLPASEAPP